MVWGIEDSFDVAPNTPGVVSVLAGAAKRFGLGVLVTDSELTALEDVAEFTVDLNEKKGEAVLAGCADFTAAKGLADGGGPAGVVEGLKKILADLVGVVGGAGSFLSRILWKSAAVCDVPVALCAGCELAASGIGRARFELSLERLSSALRFVKDWSAGKSIAGMELSAL